MPTVTVVTGRPLRSSSCNAPARETRRSRTTAWRCLTSPPPPTPTCSVNDLVFLVFEFEMRNIEGSHGLESYGECGIGATRRLLAQIPPDPSQYPKESCPIEPLAFTVCAIAHRRVLTSASRRVVRPQL